MEEETTYDEFIAETITEIIDPVAESLVDVYYPAPPPNLLVPPKVWREQKKREIRDILSGASIRKTVDNGLKIFFAYAKAQLPPADTEKTLKEWDDGTAAYSKFLSEQQGSTAAETSPETVMNLTKETIDHIYTAGLREYEKKEFRNAADVLTVLTELNRGRHNVWLSLGMALENNKEIDPALEAYRMAIITNPKDPIPYVYTAECHILNRNFTQAKLFLENAREIATEAKPKQEDLLEYINKLKEDCK